MHSAFNYFELNLTRQKKLKELKIMFEDKNKCHLSVAPLAKGVIKLSPENKQFQSLTIENIGSLPIFNTVKLFACHGITKVNLFVDKIRGTAEELAEKTQM